MNDIEKNNEEILWMRIAEVVARAESCKTPEVAIVWANKITDSFKKRYNREVKA